jgi:hypothetical protein
MNIECYVVSSLGHKLLLNLHRFVIVLKPAANEDMAWNHFFGPFQPSLWFGLIACILVIAGCLSLFSYMGQRLAYPEYEPPKQYTFFVSTFYVFSMFCQQGKNEFTLLLLRILLACY